MWRTTDSNCLMFWYLGYGVLLFFVEGDIGHSVSTTACSSIHFIRSTAYGIAKERFNVDIRGCHRLGY